MGKTVSIVCDGCGTDLTYTGNAVDYRLALESENKGHRRGNNVVTSAMMYPAIEQSKFFCGLPCLDHWSDRRRYKNSLWREWHEKWKQEHGTKHGNSWSYPVAPSETTNKVEADFQAAALEKYPAGRP